LKRAEKRREPHRKSRGTREPHRKSKGTPEPHRKSWRWLGVGFAALLIFVVVFDAAGIRGAKVDESPKEIIGAWVTSDPRYQDRTLEITRYRILFRNPHTRASANHIQEIKKYREGTRTLYEIVYLDNEKLVNRITFYHSQGKSGEIIQLKHQEKMNWTRALLPQEFTAEASG
jgi:hypothetical protein